MSEDDDNTLDDNRLDEPDDEPGDESMTLFESLHPRPEPTDPPAPVPDDRPMRLERRHAPPITVVDEHPRKDPPPPLHLPRGSVRALVTLVLAATFWLVLVMGRTMPSVLTELVLTTVGYYFGYRKKSSAVAAADQPPTGNDALPEVEESKERPLNLPAGCIRALLLGGFAISILVTAARGGWSPGLWQFVVILSGLVAGYLVAKIAAGIDPWSPVRLVMRHAMAFIVLAAVGTLAVMTVADLGDRHDGLVLCLAGVVTFYFGSRS